MLLIYNVLLDEEKRSKYDHVFSKIFTDLNISFEVRYLHDNLSEKELLHFQHLLVSGSELFATEENEENDKVSRVIRSFLSRKRAVLGICYGHQILAKTISGKKICRRRSKPEFGWKKVKLKPNSLFKGIKDPVFYESHFDEVYDLDDDYKIIAQNQDCAVQAFQYKNLPVWGVQFHPEVEYETGEASLQKLFKEYQDKRKHYQNEMTDISNFQQRLKIFENFAAYVR